MRCSSAEIMEYSLSDYVIMSMIIEVIINLATIESFSENFLIGEQHLQNAFIITMRNVFEDNSF